MLAEGSGPCPGLLAYSSPGPGTLPRLSVLFQPLALSPGPLSRGPRPALSRLRARSSLLTSSRPAAWPRRVEAPT